MYICVFTCVYCWGMLCSCVCVYASSLHLGAKQCIQPNQSIRIDDKSMCCVPQKVFSLLRPIYIYIYICNVEGVRWLVIIMLYHIQRKDAHDAKTDLFMKAMVYTVYFRSTICFLPPARAREREMCGHHQRRRAF